MATSQFLDTNILLRVILQDNPKQLAKINDLLAQPDVTFHISDLSIAEIVFVLSGPSYKFSRPQIATALSALIQIPNFSLNRTLFNQAITPYIKHPSLSFIDCCLATQAKLGSALPLFTFDQKLAKSLPEAVEL